jgi:imidazole glycerol-phosphate synthase subunit HisH
MMNIGILDYGVGNVGSLLNMFRRLDLEAHVVSTPDALARVPRLVLAGVGAFDHARRELTARGLTEPLSAYAASGRPLLGICLGMQLLVDSSDEGKLPGLGYIPGKCMRLDPPIELDLRVPHMGWNSIIPDRGSDLFRGLDDMSRFYFAHSFFVGCHDDSNVLAWTDYGGKFPSMIARDNIVGAQFHPEKSHAFGMTLLENWSCR